MRIQRCIYIYMCVCILILYMCLYNSERCVCQCALIYTIYTSPGTQLKGIFGIEILIFNKGCIKFGPKKHKKFSSIIIILVYFYNFLSLSITSCSFNHIPCVPNGINLRGDAMVHFNEFFSPNDLQS